MKFLSRLTKRLVLEYSPLEHLYAHAQKVHETVNKLAEVVGKYVEEEPFNSDEVARLEHGADQIKQEIREKLPRSDLLMPVARSDLLSFLWQQDQIADTCQDAASLLPLLQVSLSNDFKEKMEKLSKLMMKVADKYQILVKSSNETFTGSRTRKQIDEIWAMINEINVLEHEADKVTGQLIKMIYKDKEQEWFEKYHLIQVILMLDNIIDHMENASASLRIMTAR